MAHLLKIQVNQSALATLLVLLFIVPSFLPIVGADDTDEADESSTTGRAAQLDFYFRDPLQLGNAGSSIIDSTFYLEPGQHTVTVNISATGSGSGEYWLELQHKGAANLGFTTVATNYMGAQNGNGGTIDFISTSFTWDATSGAGQELQVEIGSSNEAGNLLLNNIQSIGPAFSVEHKHFGEVLTNTFPETLVSTSQMTLSHATHLLNVTVTNSGVKNISAQMEIVLTSNGTDPDIIILSPTVTLSPGSYPPSPMTMQEHGILSASVDASALTGVWNLTATVTFLGTAWSEEVTVDETWVKFSDYNAIVLEPATLIAEPGEQTVMTFILRNIGANADGYSIALAQSLVSPDDWAISVDQLTSTVPPDPQTGSTRLVTVTVQVPVTAARGDSNKITLTFTSSTGAGDGPPTNYDIVASGFVMVGDFYDGTVAITQDPLLVKAMIPGGDVNFTAIITNTGSVYSSFALSSGLSVNALNWTHSLESSGSSTTTTPFIAPGATHSVIIRISSPPIQYPLVSSEHNAADDTLDVWIQSYPIGGGVPTIDSAPIRVEAIIAVDPGISSEPYMMTLEELADTEGEIFSLHPELNLRVINNLPLDDPTALLDEELTATIAVTKSFTAANEGGFDEASRWSASVSNPIYNALTPLSSVDTTLNIAGPQKGTLPVAGTLSVIVTVTSQLGGPLSAAAIVTASIPQTYTIVVPSIIQGTFVDKEPEPIPAGVDVTLPLRFVNTGNDVGSYRLRIVNDLPANWVANFSDTDSSVDNLTYDLADGLINPPLESGSVAHTQSVNFNVKTDPLAPAGLYQPIRIRIENPISGQLLGDEFVFEVIVLASVNATLSPTTQIVQQAVSEQDWTTVTLRNTGNAPTDYTIDLDTTLAGAVTFELLSPANSKLFIAAGFEEEIRVQMTANPDANADGVYMATINVNGDDGEIMLSADIVVNISELHSFGITAPNQMSVTPGMQEKVEFDIVNNGNSEETVTINFTVQGNMTLSVYSMSKTIPINGTISDQVVVSIPSLGGTDSLAEGAMYNLTITVYNLTAGTAYDGAKKVQLLVQPLFIVESSDWPSIMEFRPESDRTWEVTFTNTGNQDVTVNVGYSITRPGLPNLSGDWEMVSLSSQIYLPRNTPVVHHFTVVQSFAQPLLTLTADLNLYLNPMNTSVEGSGEFTTQLVMSRLYSTGEIGLQPELDDGPKIIPIPYTHIPIVNGSDISYEVELCDSERLIGISSLGQNPMDYAWSFTFVEEKPDGSIERHPLDLEQECGSTSLGPTSRYNLPAQSPWNPSTFTLEADIPDQGSILPGDGWDLKFRLYHPDENMGYTVFTEETFTLVLAVFADPMIKSISSVGDFEEGSESVITVVVQNVGSAKALDVIVDLQCVGLSVSTKVGETPTLYPGSVNGGMAQTMIKVFEPGDISTLQWLATAESIDWWMQKTDVTCTATLNASYMDSNVEANDVGVLKSEVTSWSPGVQNSFIACVICLLVSFILFRLTAQNDNFRLLGIYSGVLGLGFSFHIFGEAWWGFVILGLSALWIWRVSWGSTEEFRLLHEDYQRARKGVSTLYADHFDELANTRRQLSVILAVPVLGMLAIVLGIPPTLTIDKVNMISLVAYVVVVIVGVWLLIKRADAMYGSLYGRLTDIEVKSIRLERDLSDPARLFNELAGDGLNLDEIFGDIESPRSMNPEAIFQNEEVNDDAR